MAQFVGQRAEPRSLGERGEREIHQDIGPTFLAYLVPAFDAGDATEHRERSCDAAEGLRQLRGSREFAVNREAPALGDERHERLDQCLVVGYEFVTLFDAGDVALPGDPVHGE